MGEEPEKIRITRRQGKDIRAIGSDTTDEDKRAALGKVADALRAKNEREGDGRG
jgi:hypothetical protein